MISMTLMSFFVNHARILIPQRSWISMLAREERWGVTEVIFMMEWVERDG